MPGRSRLVCKPRFSSRCGISRNPDDPVARQPVSPFNDSSATVETMDDLKDIRSVQVLNVDDEYSTLSPNGLLLSGSKPETNSFIVSDADEELLILIEFTHSVDLHSMKIYALPLDEDTEMEDVSPPKQIHLFKLSNLNHDFDDIKGLKPNKSIKCSSKKLLKGQMVNLRKKTSNPLAFQRIKYLAVFIESNQDDTEKTYIHGLSLKGDLGANTKTKNIVIGGLNQKCYCSRHKLTPHTMRGAVDPNTPSIRCFCCQRMPKDNVYYRCTLRREICLFHRLTNWEYKICSECFTASVPAEIMENAIYSGNDYDEKEVFIHRKVMVSLNRIS